MSGSILLLALLSMPFASAQEEDEEDADGQEAPAPPPVPTPPVEAVHAPPPEAGGEPGAVGSLAVDPAPPPPPSGPPPGWRAVGASPQERPPGPEAPTWQGTYAQVGVMGGQLVGGGVVFVSPGGVAFDLSAGPRVGFGEELYANLFGMMGLSWTGGSRSRHGLFARGGASLPLDRWFEAMAAGGYTFRFHTGRGDWTGADIGAGMMLVQDLPSGFQPWPGMLYLRWAMEFSTSAGQRGG
ncbi:hypothetical protein L6R53_15295 [Myxococcota bacterium]|nr:hypothetical protein [Myxococcota bacterium]